MKIYLVGGAVRDQLLQRKVTEKDYVVVGATVQEMLKLGYRQVGKDFPVFLHPETHEEYALARRERKVGRGYTGFTFDTSTHVTLQEDLIRRDLTVNAIAETAEGELVDPYHGKEDLALRILRHVSPAFAEDPVRILRVARFAARFFELGFTVAPETVTLMESMVQSGEVDALVAERVWKELERALSENHPEVFFHVLANCQALAVLFPQIERNGRGVSALKKAAGMTIDKQVRFAALLHDLSVVDIKTLAERYRIPSDFRDLAVLVAKYHAQYEHIKELSAEELVDFMQLLDAYRREFRFKNFLLTCQIIYGHLESYHFLEKCFNAAKSIDTAAFAKDLVGPAIGARLRAERIQQIEKLNS
jgi:tRNA nucleotidyltransferase (CCA-adding enzyme)